MTSEYEVSSVNRVRQLREKAAYDRETVHGILDRALCAQVAFVEDGCPVIVPMIYGREGEVLYLHGARKARVIRLLEKSPRACVSVTLVDGIVFARSAFNSSMNYRSVTVFGVPELVEGGEKKLHAMRVISEHTMPGRWAELRPPHEREVKMTGVIRLEIESASAKVSAGPPSDEEEDYSLPVWAGVLPLRSRFDEPVTDARAADGTPVSASVSALVGRLL